MVLPRSHWSRCMHAQPAPAGGIVSNFCHFNSAYAIKHHLCHIFMRGNTYAKTKNQLSDRLIRFLSRRIDQTSSPWALGLVQARSLLVCSCAPNSNSCAPNSNTCAHAQHLPRRRRMLTTRALRRYLCRLEWRCKRTWHPSTIRRHCHKSRRA
jgi:hypothetical protein